MYKIFKIIGLVAALLLMQTVSLVSAVELQADFSETSCGQVRHGEVGGTAEMSQPSDCQNVDGCQMNHMCCGLNFIVLVQESNDISEFEEIQGAADCGDLLSVFINIPLPPPKSSQLYS